MREKIQALLARLNHGLVEREATLKIALLTVLAGENIVLIGPPGTGKSMLARRIAESLDGAHQGGYFEYLLTKFSTPEEIFGPLSISALKQDVFKRNTTGYLPSVRVGFLDEIFKASSSILNALLTILNERKFHNGAQVEEVPLQALIAASNELPTGQQELAALYDRFLVRGFVDYVSSEGLLQMLGASVGEHQSLPDHLRIRPADMENLREKAKAVTVPPSIGQALLKIWQAHKEAFKEDAREQLSDRRLMKCLNLMYVSAATNGREEVNASDVLLLKDCLWSHLGNRVKVMDLILDQLKTIFQTAKAGSISAEGTIKHLTGADFGFHRHSLRKSMGAWPALAMMDDSQRLWTVREILVQKGNFVASTSTLILVKDGDGKTTRVAAKHAGVIKFMKVRVGDVIESKTPIVEIDLQGAESKTEVVTEDLLTPQLHSNIWL